MEPKFLMGMMSLPFGLAQDYMIDADVVAGALAMRSAATNSAGEIIDAVVGTGNVGVIGVYSETKAYTATQATLISGGNSRLGVTVRVVNHPLQVILARMSGSATFGAAPALTTPAHILTNTVASAGGTLISATEVGTITFVGGRVIGLTGANGGEQRRLSAHADNVSTTVEVPFSRAIGVGDQFMRCPFSKAVNDIDLTTDFREVNGVVEVGTAAGEFNCFDIVMDHINREIYLYIAPRDHLFSPVAA